MQFIIISGMSGSGKTQAVRFFEDAGYFCVDNMPPVLIPKFTEMLSSITGKYDRVALVIDVRVGDMISELIDQIQQLKKSGHDCRLIFLNADNETLIKRYKETRRSHPVGDRKGLLASIIKEREMLKELYEGADYVIDTSNMKNDELSRALKEIDLCDSDKPQTLTVNVMSFGFKYGMPLDADLVFDVRCFPNPFYIPELRKKTGNDKKVQEYVMSFSEAQGFMDRLCDMMRFLMPLYIEEGKTTLTVAIGCTGGRHRSVTMANVLASDLKRQGYSVIRNDRDIKRG